MFEKLIVDVQKIIADIKNPSIVNVLDALKVLSDVSQEAYSLAKNIGIIKGEMHATAAPEGCPTETVAACEWCCEKFKTAPNEMKSLPFGGFFLEIVLKLITQWIATKVSQPATA